MAITPAGGGVSTSTGSGPTGSRYDPDRTPTTGLDPACSDNFIGGPQLTWRWGNQGTSTITTEMDTQLLVPQIGAGENIRARWITAPSAVDFSTTAKLTIIRQGDFNQGGILLLSAGTEATPTKLDRLMIFAAGQQKWERSTFTSYTGGGADVATANLNSYITGMPWGHYYLQWRYTASSKNLGAYLTDEGMTWVLVSNRTLAAHPISIGWFANSTSATIAPMVRIFWFRTFTSGINGATAAQYLNGVVGQ